MTAQLAQVAAALLAAATPWVVTEIAYRVAAGHVGGSALTTAGTQSYRRLQLATLVAASAATGVAALIPAPSLWPTIVSGVVFAGLAPLGLRALADLDARSLPMRHIESPTRTASLAVRRHRHYQAPWWRTTLYGLTMVALGLFVWRLAQPSPVDRRLLVPVACSVSAIAFLWLYEIWIRDLVAGPVTPEALESEQRRRKIRWVFFMECLLTTAFLGLAHSVLDIDWTTAGWMPLVVVAVGGGLGVIGCALVLSADLGSSRYKIVPE